MNHILALILIVGSLALAQEPKPPDQPPASDAAAAGPKQPAPPKIKTMEEGLKGKKEIPDNRTRPAKTMPDHVVERVLCQRCGVLRDTVSQRRRAACGDTVTSNPKKIAQRTGVVDRLLGEIDKATAEGKSAEVVRRYQDSLTHLRETLAIPPATAKRVDHDMVDILLEKNGRPKAVAICRACRTLSLDRRDGRRMAGLRCQGGAPRNGSDRKRRDLIAHMSAAADRAGENTRKEYQRALEFLRPRTDRETGKRLLGLQAEGKATSGEADAASRSGLPTTPSRKWQRRAGSTAASSSGIGSPLLA